MKILSVTNMYPAGDRPNYGIFVKEQIDAVAGRFGDVEYDVYNIDNSNGNTAYVRSVFRVNSLVDSCGYDLVHIHYGLSGLFLLFPFLRRRHIPVVMTLHGGDIQPEQGKTVQVWLTRRALRRVDVAISLNDRMTALIKPYCSEVVKIPCSVNTDIFTPPASREPLGSKKELTVIFPSDRSRKVKNFPLYESVLKAYSDRYGTVIHQLELKDMNRSEIAGALRRADLMLMTSVSEGSPQVVKEAMACNLPVVSTNVGDIETLLSGVVSSAWSETPEVGNLVECMRRVVTGQVDGVAGRDRLLSLNLDNDSVAGRVYDVYKSLILK